MKRFFEKKASVVVFICSFFLLTFPSLTRAATYTWDGGGADNNWSTCANWSSDICPTSADSVIFSSVSTKNATIDTSIVIFGLTINSGYTGTIAPASSAQTIALASFTQSDGTFTASAATTTVNNSFIINAGIFNHNNGMMEFLSSANATVTPNGNTFYNVAFGRTGPASNITVNLGSDMTVNGNMYLLNASSSSGVTLQSSVSASKNITILGNLVFPSTSGSGNVSFGGGATFNFNTTVYGNFDITDANVVYNSDTFFASSSNQTINKNSSASINNLSDWYDTGTGNFILTANFSGNQKLNTDSDDDFNFVATPFTFTAGDISISTGTTFSPAGASSYSFNAFNLSTGTFNSNGSTTIFGFNQTGGTFNAGSGTTTMTGNFTYTSGTFNAGTGNILFKFLSTYTITPGAVVFNNVIFDRSGGAGGFTANLASDMTISGNLILLNTDASGQTLTIQSNLSTTTRNITVGGNLSMPSTSATGGISVAPGSTNTVNIILSGNFDMADSGITFFGDVTFASSSTQTLTKTAGTISNTSRWYDTGSGNLALSANFSGSQILFPNDPTDFNFVTTSFTFTTGSVIVATSTTFTPLGPSTYTIANLIHNVGTIVASSSTVFASTTINGGIFNAASNSTTTFTGAFWFISGTFNHNNGTSSFLMPPALNATITPNSAVFNNVVVDYANASGVAGILSLASDMTVTGDFFVQNTNSGGGSFTFLSNLSGTTRTITVGGKLMMPTTSSAATLNVGNGASTYPINFVVSGDFIMNDSSVTLNADVTFASSSTQTLTKTAGTISSFSDWYDTGSGNLALSANFSGSQILQPDSASDFQFSSTAFTFTTGGVIVAPGTTFNPTGPATYTITSLFHSTGTIQAASSTVFASTTMNGGNIEATPNGLLTIAGPFTYYSGTFNHNNGTTSVILSSGINPVLNFGTMTFNHMSFEYGGSSGSSASANIASDINILGNLTIQNTNSGGGSYSVVSNISNTNRNLNVGGSLIFASTTVGGSLSFGGGSTFPLTTYVGGDIQMLDGSVTLLGDIVFNGAGVQTMNKTFGIINAASDWTVNKTSGEVGLGSAWTTLFSGTMNVATGTLRLNNFSYTFATTTIGASGTLKLHGSETISTTTFSSGSTALYEGTGASYTLKNIAYQNLVIQGGSTTTLSLPAALTVSQNLQINSGTLDVTASNYGLNVGGNWSNIGTFNARNGTTTFTGTNQTITGTTTFYNFVKTVSSADTLTFGAGQTQTITNNWIVNGVSGNLLSLRSTSNGVQWNVNPQGTRSVSYTNVKDSNNTNVTPVSINGTMVNAGNNTNWGFDVTPPVTSGVNVTPGITTASISWTTDEPATSVLYIGPTTSYGTASTSLGTTNHSVSLTGLTSATTYHYIIVATDAAGNTSTTSDATFNTIDNVPPVLSNIASSTTFTTATITWNTNEVATSTIDFGLTTSYGTASSSNVSTTSHRFVLSGLTLNTAYHYRISSWDASGNLATSSDLIFTTQADVTAPVISAISSSTNITTATISWTTNETATSYIDFGTTVSYGTASTSLGATNHSVSLTGLTGSTPYHFRITATDPSNNVAVSSDYIFTTAAVPDSTPAIITNGQPSAILPLGTRSVNISVDTNEPATCRYGIAPNTVYASIANTFSTTGGTQHVKSVDVTEGTAYVYYVRCVDTNANENTTDYVIRFSVEGNRIIGPQGGNVPLPVPEELQVKKPVENKNGGFVFKKNLQVGDQNNDVKELQKFLNKKGFVIAKKGPGSPGKENGAFGPATKNALIKFQKANNIKPANGRLGPATRKAINGI